MLTSTLKTSGCYKNTWGQGGWLSLSQLEQLSSDNHAQEELILLLVAPSQLS